VTVAKCDMGKVEKLLAKYNWLQYHQTIVAFPNL
jgi:hypothetical protein